MQRHVAGQTPVCQLTEIKKEKGHGHWIPWIEENLPFTRKTAAKYIKLTKCNPKLHSGIDDAYKLLSEGPEEVHDEEEVVRRTSIWLLDRSCVSPAYPFGGMLLPALRMARVWLLSVSRLITGCRK